MRVPWTARRSNKSILKEISPEYSLEGLMLKLKHQDLGHLMPSIFPSISVFSIESVLHIRWPVYWSFSVSINPSNKYSGLILVRSPCNSRDFRESSPTPQFKSISSLALSFLYGPTLTSIHDYCKNHSFD